MIVDRLRAWWKRQPTVFDQAVPSGDFDDYVVIRACHWDGFPTGVDECRRSYSFGDGVESLDFINVKCPTCGDAILAHN